MKHILLPLCCLAVLLSGCDIDIYDTPYDPRQNFVGYYEAEEFSETYGVVSYYELDILTDNDPYSNRIYLRNFYGYPIEVFARVSGNRFTIPRQEIDGLIIQGTGRVNGNEIAMTYSVQDLADRRAVTDFCNTVLYFP